MLTETRHAFSPKAGERLRRRHARTRFIRLAAIAMAASSIGCSTLVSPTSDLGASLTLATVEHVSDREEDLERRVRDDLERRVSEEVAAARAEDQERIEALQAELELRNQELGEIAAALARSEQKVADLADIMKLGLEGLTNEAVQMRSTTQRLDAEIQRLPYEALRQLNQAIDVHLVNQPAPRTAAQSGDRPILTRTPSPPPVSPATSVDALVKSTPNQTVTP